jgi:hypothetical protein
VREESGGEEQRGGVSGGERCARHSVGPRHDHARGLGCEGSVTRARFTGGGATSPAEAEADTRSGSDNTPGDSSSSTLGPHLQRTTRCSVNELLITPA